MIVLKISLIMEILKRLIKQNTEYYHKKDIKRAHKIKNEVNL